MLKSSIRSCSLRVFFGACSSFLNTSPTKRTVRSIAISPRIVLKYCQYKESDYRFLRVRCDIFPILNLINNIVNNVLFLFLSIIVDIWMIRFANKNYEHKIKLFHDKKHLNEALEHKKKIRKLIITNGCLYFVSHVPEFVSTLLLIVFKERIKYFCWYYLHGNKWDFRSV